MQHRLITQNDFEALYNLYMDESANAYLTYDPMPTEEFNVVFNELLATATVYAVEWNNEVVATYRLVNNKYRQSHIIYIGSFAVKSNMKGKGIGTNILRHIKQRALAIGKKRIELTVAINNNVAVQLYQKNGFEIEGILKKNYSLNSTGEYYDEYLMSLIL